MNKKIVVFSMVILIGGIVCISRPKKEMHTIMVPKETFQEENVMAIYLKDGDNYKQINAIPTEGNYVLNNTETYCTEPGNEEELKDRVAYDSSTKTLSVSTLTKKNTKCYLYFDKQLTSKEVLENTLKQSSLGEVNSFTGTACGGSCDITTQNGIYEVEDDYGTSYYYRGTVNNNWVVFGQEKNSNKYIWWRIIRINGNGTIRLIYAGTSSDKKTAPNPQGVDTMITPRKTINNSYPRAVYFNQNYNDNTYVGYMTGGIGKSKYEETHTNASNSTVLDEIVNWYTNNTNLGTLAADYIDVDTGFCGDRQVDKTVLTSYQGEGYGTSQTGYAPWGRLYNNNWKKTQTPTLKCGYKSDGSTDKTAQERDLYTGPNANTSGTKGSNGTIVKGNNKLPVPVGLITSDEVVFAGGFGGTANNGYWLYTNQYYWTMSPFYYPNASVFIVNANGGLSNFGVNNDVFGVRPVINLKAGTKFTVESGTEGSRQNPYVVQT